MTGESQADKSVEVNDGPQAETAKLVIERLTAIAGLATATVAIIYGAGAAVYAAALSSRDVPSAMSIATGLPRELLIGNGLLYVGVPVAVTALGLFLLTPILKWNRQVWALRIVAAFLVLGGISLGVAVQPSSIWGFIGVIVGVLVTALVLTVLLVTLADGATIGGKIGDAITGGSRRRARVYLIVLGVALMTAWGVLIGTARTPLPDALLCTTGGNSYPGFLIGETSSKVYVGEELSEAISGDRRIISVPNGQVGKLFIGSSGGLCDAPEEPKPRPESKQGAGK